LYAHLLNTDDTKLLQVLIDVKLLATLSTSMCAQTLVTAFDTPIQ